MGHCPKGITFDRPKGLRVVWLSAAGRRHIYASPHRVIPQPSTLRAVKPKNPPADRPVKPKNLPVQPFYAACLRQQATTLGAKGPVNLPWNVKDPHHEEVPGKNPAEKGKEENFPFPAAAIPSARYRRKDKTAAEHVTSAKTLTPCVVKKQMHFCAAALLHHSPMPRGPHHGPYRKSGKTKTPFPYLLQK